jgi:hypothetical protein
MEADQLAEVVDTIDHRAAGDAARIVNGIEKDTSNVLAVVPAAIYPWDTLIESI